MVDPIYAAHIATLLLILGDTSDGTEGCWLGFARWHSRGKILSDLLLEVEAQLGSEFAVDGAALE